MKEKNYSSIHEFILNVGSAHVNNPALCECAQFMNYSRALG